LHGIAIDRLFTADDTQTHNRRFDFANGRLNSLAQVVAGRRLAGE